MATPERPSTDSDIELSERQTSLREARQKTIDYLGRHRYAIVDRHRAEIMAYATKDLETAIVEARHLALEAAVAIGDVAFQDSEGRNAIDSASYHVAVAKQSRCKADSIASQAGAIYDQVGRTKV